MIHIGKSVLCLQRLDSCEMWRVFTCVETRLVPVLAAMELRPFCVDTHTLLQLSEILKVGNL